MIVLEVGGLEIIELTPTLIQVQYLLFLHRA
jgi:hypothetical protein